jgi:hypothetical protein
MGLRWLPINLTRLLRTHSTIANDTDTNGGQREKTA